MSFRCSCHEMLWRNKFTQSLLAVASGGLTTFNILFKNKDDQFRTRAVDVRLIVDPTHK